MKKSNKINLYGVYSILFIIISFIIFSPFLFRGNSFIPNADGYNQTFPVFVYCREFWLNLLQGNTKTFDFSIGLGDDVLVALGWPGLFDVFSVVSGLLFPKHLIEFAYGFSILLKFYLAGISFMLFAKEYVRADEYVILGALLYSFNIYELFWGMNWSPFLCAPITLPLILLGIDKICKNDKVSFWMIVALFIQGLNGFYILYIEIIIVIIYFMFVAFFRLYNQNHYNLKQIISITGWVALNGFLGVLSSAIILFPTIAGLFSSTREIGGEAFNRQLVCSMEEYVSSFGDLFIPDVYDNVITMPVIFIGGILVYLFVKNGKKEFRYISIMMCLLMWCPLWGSITNGFSYSGNRWLFVVSFFASIATILALDSKEQISALSQKLYGVIVLISIIIHFVQSEKNIGLGIRICVFCFLAICFMYVWQVQKYRKKVVLAYGCLVLICMGLFTFGPKKLGGCGYSANFKEWGTYTEILESSREIVETGSEFERWDIYDSSLAASLVADYYGTSEYFSMLNSNTSDFYQKMYISPGIKVASFILRGLDSRQEIMSLLSVSHYMDYKTNKDDVYAVIKENEFQIPFGFTYDSYILEEDFLNLNPMDRASQLLHTVVLENENLSFEYAKVTKQNAKQIDYKIKELDNGKIRIYPQLDEFAVDSVKQSSELYFSVKDLCGSGYLYVGNKEVEMKDPTYEYYTGIDEFWIHISELLTDSAGYYFDVFFDGNSDFEVNKIRLYCHNVDYGAICKRQENYLEDLKIENNSIKGKITNNQNELLFLSIPYSSGWQAYVDNEPVDILKANIGFMALPLAGGEHEIYLQYETPGLKVGMICSVVAFISLMILYIYSKKESQIE